MTILLEEETNEGKKLDFEYRALLETVVRTVLEAEQFTEQIQVSVTFTDEQEIAQINHNFRQISEPTDVLSFPMLEFTRDGDALSFIEESADRDPDSGELLLGDIVLCIPRVFSQAREYGHSARREYAFLLVHSMLHLLGYDHIREGDRVRMEERQRVIMEQLGVSRDDAD